MDKSNESIINVSVINITDLGASRGDFLYYLGYRKTELDCKIENRDVTFTVPSHSSKHLLVDDTIVVGVRNGAIGLKYCYIIFDEDFQVAETLPEYRTEGRWIKQNVAQGTKLCALEN